MAINRATSIKTPAIVSHLIEPLLPLGIACRIHHQQQGLAYRVHLGEI
jgi:hypothetical protein